MCRYGCTATEVLKISAAGGKNVPGCAIFLLRSCAGRGKTCGGRHL